MVTYMVVCFHDSPFGSLLPVRWRMDALNNIPELLLCLLHFFVLFKKKL